MLVDSHCHLTDRRYEGDRWEVLAQARAAGVEKILTICSDADDTQRVEDLLRDSSEKEGIPELWGTSGIHPHEAETTASSDMARIRQVAETNPRVVAVGETGLDFFYDNSPREVQEALFRAHLELSEALDLPVVVHSRDADELTGQILRDWSGRVRGVLHCFTGGKELLTTALDLGWMISLTGIVTFKNYDGQELVRSIPRDRLMTETDGPYLAPTPFRGHRNVPAYVARVAEELAAIRGETPDELANYTAGNAVRFFRMEN